MILLLTTFWQYKKNINSIHFPTCKLLFELIQEFLRKLFQFILKLLFEKIQEFL
jgi:hypothetical protein